MLPKKHFNPSRYPCPFCQRKLHNKSGLTQHVNREHAYERPQLDPPIPPSEDASQAATTPSSSSIPDRILPPASVADEGNDGALPDCAQSPQPAPPSLASDTLHRIYHPIINGTLSFFFSWHLTFSLFMSGDRRKPLRWQRKSYTG